MSTPPQITSALDKQNKIYSGTAFTMPGSASTDQDAQLYQASLDPWNVVYLAGNQLPGLCTVDGNGLVRKTDQYWVNGFASRAIIDMGLDLADVKINILIWSQAQLDSFKKIITALLPRKILKPTSAVDIVHPAVNCIGINSVYVLKTGMPKLGNIKGTIQVDIDCTEYRPLYPAKPGQVDRGNWGGPVKPATATTNVQNISGNEQKKYQPSESYLDPLGYSR